MSSDGSQNTRRNRYIASGWKWHRRTRSAPVMQPKPVPSPEDAEDRKIRKVKRWKIWEENLCKN